MAGMCCRRWTSLLVIVGFAVSCRWAAADEADAFVGVKAGEERIIALTPALSQGERERPTLTPALSQKEREKAGIKVCWCPPGKFLMGSPENEPDRRPDEGPVEVRLTKGFWMGKYEVTRSGGANFLFAAANNCIMW